LKNLDADYSKLSSEALKDYSIEYLFSKEPVIYQQNPNLAGPTEKKGVRKGD